MPQFTFSNLTNGQVLSLNPDSDVLHFGGVSDNAGLVRLSIATGKLGFTYQGKTIWLANIKLEELSLTNVTFANGSILGLGDGSSDFFIDWYGQEYTLQSSTKSNQIWGLGGADLIQTGSGSDWLVGNTAFTPINHVSRVGSVGSPTASNHASISADGRFVGFDGGWTQFGSTSNASDNVLVKDMSSGTVSVEDKNSAGQVTSGSAAAVISADGNYLAFLSSASTLLPQQDNSLYDIYVAAVNGSGVERVSTGTGGTLAADGRSLNPDISANGRYVVFHSSTSNWAPGGSSNFYDIFVKDRVTGTLTRVSTSTSGTDGNGDSTDAKISVDGRFVVFESVASNLSVGDTNGRSDIFVWDRNDGSLTNITKDIVPVSNPNNGNNNPDIAFDNGWGGIVVFETARNLVAEDKFNGTDIYAYNLIDDTLQLVSSKADGTGVQLSSSDASVSGDGRFVVFTSSSNELVPGDNNGSRDVFVKDLYTGAIALVSKTATGAGANQHSGKAQISLGGDWIVFESNANNLAQTDANGTLTDIYRVSNPLLKDNLMGGAGNDTYEINRADTITEKVNGGTDTVISTISYKLGVNLENLTLAGKANLNGIGNNLNNLILANTGNNHIDGGTGIDTVSYSKGALSGVTVSLASLTAQVTNGSGTDSLSNIERLIGSAFGDNLTGNSGNNVLTGAAGKDILTGNGGNDIFDFNALADMSPASNATDIITDFNGGDKIDLSTIDANVASTATNDAFTGFIANTANFTSAGQLKFVAGVLFGNTDTDANAEFAISLTGVNAIAVSDIVL